MAEAPHVHRNARYAATRYCNVLPLSSYTQTDPLTWTWESCTTETSCQWFAMYLWWGFESGRPRRPSQTIMWVWLIPSWPDLAQDRRGLPAPTHPASRHEKKCRHRRLAWGTFWMAGEHFGPKFTLFCRILQFVGNHALLRKVKLYALLLLLL